MKVLHVESGKNLYGGALQVYYLMRELHAKYQVKNILVCPTNSDIGRQSRDIAEVIEVPLKGELDYRLVKFLSQAIYRHKPDLLHAHSRRGADLWTAIAAARTHTQSILTRRVDNLENPIFARWKYGKYQRVVAISEGIRQVILKTGFNEHNTQTIHSAVDTELFTPNRQRENFNNRFNLTNNDLVIGVVAQLIPRKGHMVLLKEYKEIRSKFSNAKLLLLGKGKSEKELRQYCYEQNFADDVIFAGFQHDIENILPNLDLIVHPAFTEGLGVALLQASAAAVAVVASSVGGIPEIIRNNQNGLLVPPKDGTKLREAILTLLADEKTRWHMGSNGREIVKKEFSIAKMASDNFNLYQKLISQPKNTIAS